MPFLETGDPDLVLDVDFTTGQTAVEAILETTEGFTKRGTPSGTDWDSTRGYNPNGSHGWRTAGNWVPSALSARSEMYDKGGVTIAIEVERSAIQATWLDLDSAFIDNAEGPSVNDAADFTAGVAAYRYLWHTLDALTAPNCEAYAFGQVTWSGSDPRWRLITGVDDGAVDNFWSAMLCGASDQLGDTVILSYVVDFRSRIVEVYIDGMLAKRTTWDATTFGSAANGTDIFYRIGIFTHVTLTGRYFKGYVKRWQLIKRICRNRAPAGHRIAVLGDSYVQSATSQDTPGTADVAGMDAVQNFALGLAAQYSRGATAVLNPFVDVHPMPWLVQLATVAASNGQPLRLYNAGLSGKTWATGDANVLPDYVFDATIAYDPQYVIILGSVNDINASSDPADVLSGMTSRIDDLIAGCANLRAILLLTTPPTVGISTWWSAAKKTVLQSHVDAMKTLQGYGDIVHVFDLFGALGGTNVDVNFALGSHTNVADWDTRYTGSQTDSNIHLGQAGANMIVDAIWPVMYRMLRL